jgi:hypothetical protein
MRQGMTLEILSVCQINDEDFVVRSNSKGVSIFGMPFDGTDGVIVIGRRYTQQNPPARKKAFKTQTQKKSILKRTEHHP